MPVTALGFRGANDFFVQFAEEEEFAAFLQKAFDDADLADGFGEAATGDILVAVNFVLPVLPFAAGAGSEEDEDRIEDEEHEADLPAEVKDNDERKDGAENELQ